MQQLELTMSRVRSVWWCICWRAALGTLLSCFIFAFLFGYIDATMRVKLAPEHAAYAGAFFGTLWSFVVVGMALRKKYQDFRIVLVPRETLT